MEGSHFWLSQNWFNVVQTIACLVPLWFLAASFHRDATTKEDENLDRAIDRHAALWQQTYGPADLKRIFDPNADLSQPITQAEKEFLNILILRFQASWQRRKRVKYFTPQMLAIDVRKTFSLPLPRAVWEETISTRFPGFVQYVKKKLT